MISIYSVISNCSLSTDKGKKKLEQLAEYSLFGNIASMKPVKIGKNPRDSLILSFKDAKVIKCTVYCHIRSQ